jgi:hypothetical protein
MSSNVPNEIPKLYEGNNYSKKLVQPSTYRLFEHVDTGQILRTNTLVFALGISADQRTFALWGCESGDSLHVVERASLGNFYFLP